MQRWVLTAVTALTLVNAPLTGCNSAPHVNGFIDKSGNLVVDIDKLNPKPLAVDDYSDGLAVVQMPSGSGCLDKDGKMAFVKPFNHISAFSEGKAAFAEGKSEADQKWGYINTKGDTVIKPTYAAANKFSEGLAAVQLSAVAKNGKSAGKWCYIDERGKQIFDQTFEQADPFSEGLAAVKLNGKMGSIDRQGNFVVPPTFDVVYAANDGHIVAAQGNGLSGEHCSQVVDYFDKTGKKLLHREMKGVQLQNLTPMLWAESQMKTGAGTKIDSNAPSRPLCLSTVVTPGYCETKSIGQAGTKFCIDQCFDARAFKGGYDYIFPVTGGFMVVYSDADGGKLDYRGGVPEDASGIWNSKTFRFWDAAPFSDGLGLVEENKGGPYGYVDKSGNYALKPIYDHARSFHEDRALVGEMALHKL